MLTILENIYISVINKCMEYSPIISFPIITIVSIPMISSIMIAYSAIFVITLIASPFLAWIISHGILDVNNNTEESCFDSCIRWIKHDIEWLFMPTKY